jgi:hypothetical protein
LGKVSYYNGILFAKILIKVLLLISLSFLLAALINPAYSSDSRGRNSFD